MGVSLPSDVIFLIFDYLKEDRDFNAIYQCALSSKHLGEQALIALYQ